MIAKNNRTYEFNKIGMSLTNEQYLIKFKRFHGDENLEFEKISYASGNDKIQFICKEHGKFWDNPLKLASEKTRKFACPDCHKNFHKSKRIIEKGIKTHGNRFSYDKIKYVNSHRIENLFCLKHGIFFGCTDSTHFASHGGCPNCKKDSKRFRFTKKQKPEYDYSKMNYVDDYTPITIICKKHGIEFIQTPIYHLTKHGKCPKCVEEDKISKFIKKAREIHFDKYDYSLIKEYSSQKKLPILCKEHGIFHQLPFLHFSSFTPCPKCGERDGTDLGNFIEKCRMVHGDKYDYSSAIYKNSKTAITLICPFHGKFGILPTNHLHGKRGCPQCAEHVPSSKGEIEWLNSLKVPLRTVILEGYTVDGFDGNKTIYEFLGDYWHGNPEVFEKDKTNDTVGKTFGELFDGTFNRLNWLKEKGYKVIYIWEKDWKDGKPAKML